MSRLYLAGSNKESIMNIDIEAEIQRRLNLIEQENDVRIIYACESGSRAWGFASQDSDYDVRFIYVKNATDYLCIEKQRDVIETPIDGIYDINGWDLKKALGLLKKSNPTLIEWLKSPIIYRSDETFISLLRSMLMRSFSRNSLIYHYLNMARNNWQNDIEKGNVTAKKYLYTLRPLLCVDWIKRYDSIPPMKFQSMIEAIPGATDIKNEIRWLLEIKAQGMEKDYIRRNDIMDKYILNSFKYRDEITPNIEKPLDWRPLNQLFLKAIGI